MLQFRLAIVISIYMPNKTSDLKNNRIYIRDCSYFTLSVQGGLLSIFSPRQALLFKKNKKKCTLSLLNIFAFVKIAI